MGPALEPPRGGPGFFFFGRRNESSGREKFFALRAKNSPISRSFKLLKKADPGGRKESKSVGPNVLKELKN